MNDLPFPIPEPVNGRWTELAHDVAANARVAWAIGIVEYDDPHFQPTLRVAVCRPHGRGWQWQDIPENVARTFIAAAAAHYAAK